MESRKQAVSIRMSAADVRNVKKLARRLGARDSDVVRYAVKTMLARLSPLNDSSARGRDLVPILAEQGGDLCRHFDLDVGQLETIVNEDVEESRRIDRHDIQLIAMSQMQRSYLGARLMGQAQRLRATDGLAGLASSEQPLQAYLYEKYLSDPPTRQSERPEGDKAA